MVSYLKNCTNSSTIIVAASDSPRLDAADFVCSGSDDQDDINAIIADLPTTGGRVYFLNGTYSIDTYTYDARIDRYYGLYVAHGDDTHCQISLEGETSPWTNSFPDCTYDSSGVRFITSPTSNAFTTYGTNTYGTYALGVQGYTHTFPDVNTGIELEVKNMAFILPAQIGNHGGVDFGGIGGGVSRYIADSLVATVDVPYASLASPPAYSIGFLSVPGQNAAAVPISNCFAYGFYFGFNLCGEHHIATADYARFCTYPFY